MFGLLRRVLGRLFSRPFFLYLHFVAEALTSVLANVAIVNNDKPMWHLNFLSNKCLNFIFIFYYQYLVRNLLCNYGLGTRLALSLLPA